MACATLMFSSFIGSVAYLACVQLYYGTAGRGWLVFSSIAGRLAQAGLCSVVLRDGWPRLACVQ